MFEDNDELSVQVPLPCFDLFTIPPVQKSIIADIEEEVRPYGKPSLDKPIKLEISSITEDYIRLDLSELHVNARIHVRAVTGDVKAADWSNIYPVNNTLHSLFRKIELIYGDREITISPQAYSMKSYIEKLLGYSDSAKKSYLTSSFWLDDSERKSLTKPTSTDQSKQTIGAEFDMIDKLHLDLAYQDKALIGGTKLKIRLIPHDTPEFYLNSVTGFKPWLEIEDLFLNVHKSRVASRVVEGHAAGLRINPIVYPHTDTQLIQTTLPAGSSDFCIPNFITGKLPRRLFIFFVKTLAYNGSYTENPYNFQHFDINYLSLYVNGLQYPQRAYTPNFDKKLYCREFHKLYESLNQNHTSTYCSINRKQYANGNTIFAFNLTPDLSDGAGLVGHVNVAKLGTLGVHARFAKALEHQTTMIVYGEWDTILQIDENRVPINTV